MKKVYKFPLIVFLIVFIINSVILPLVAFFQGINPNMISIFVVGVCTSIPLALLTFLILISYKKNKLLYYALIIVSLMLGVSIVLFSVGWYSLTLTKSFFTT